MVAIPSEPTITILSGLGSVKLKKKCPCSNAPVFKEISYWFLNYQKHCWSIFRFDILNFIHNSIFLPLMKKNLMGGIWGRRQNYSFLSCYKIGSGREFKLLAQPLTTRIFVQPPIGLPPPLKRHLRGIGGGGGKIFGDFNPPPSSWNRFSPLSKGGRKNFSQWKYFSLPLKILSVPDEKIPGYASDPKIYQAPPIKMGCSWWKKSWTHLWSGSTV